MATVASLHCLDAKALERLMGERHVRSRNRRRVPPYQHPHKHTRKFTGNHRGGSPLEEVAQAAPLHLARYLQVCQPLF